MFRSAATRIAHNSTLPALAGNNDLRPLQDLINAEKNALSSWQKLSQDVNKASEALKTWGLGEGDDLGDVLNASSVLYMQLAGAIATFASYHATVRELMKSIRSKEEELDELRKRRRAVVSKADAAEKKLSKMGTEHKSIGVQTEALGRLRDEIRSLDSQIMSEEARLGDLKRSSAKQLMHLKFGGLVELAEKATIVGEAGGFIIQEIPLGITPPGQGRPLYMGHQKVEMWLNEAQRKISDVHFDTDAPLTVSAPHTGGQTFSSHVPMASESSYVYVGNPSMSTTESGIPPSNTSSYLPGITNSGMVVEGLPSPSASRFSGAAEPMDSNQSWRQSTFQQPPPQLQDNFALSAMPNVPDPMMSPRYEAPLPGPPQESISIQTAPFHGLGTGMGVGANEFGVVDHHSPASYTPQSMRPPPTTSWRLAEDPPPSAEPMTSPPSEDRAMQMQAPPPLQPQVPQVPQPGPLNHFGPGSMRGGGRFASFPVKAGPGRPGISLREGFNGPMNGRPQSPASPTIQGTPPITSPSNIYAPSQPSPASSMLMNVPPPPPIGAGPPSIPALRSRSADSDADFSFTASIANALADEGGENSHILDRAQTPKPQEPPSQGQSSPSTYAPAYVPISPPADDRESEFDHVSEPTPTPPQPEDSPVTFDSIERALDGVNGHGHEDTQPQDSSVGMALSSPPQSPSYPPPEHSPLAPPSGHRRTGSDDSGEATLSYIESEPATISQATTVNVATGESAKPTRQIRFGFYDGDVGSPLAPLTPMPYTPTAPGRTPRSTNEGTFASQQEQTPPQYDPQRGMPPPRSRMNRMTLPPPPSTFDDNDEPADLDVHDHQAVNAAATREVNRELDALSFAPVTQAEDPPRPSYSSGEGPRSPVDSRSPLVPPSPLFSGGRTPRPESPKLPATYVRERDRGGAGTPTGGVPPPLPSPSALPAPGVPSSRPPVSPMLTPAAPLNITPRSSPMPSNYGTPPEYPATPSASASNSSLPLQPPPPMGTRTISAAAFKRPPIGPAGGPRKFLPSNPRPQPKVEPQLDPQREITPPPASAQRSMSPPQLSSTPQQPSPGPGMERYQAQVVPPPDNNPLPSPYDERDEPEPQPEYQQQQQPAQAGRLRPMSQFFGGGRQQQQRPPSFAHDENRDSYYTDVLAGYDYNSESGSPTTYVPHEPNPASGGYAEGRFATNLEDDLR